MNGVVGALLLVTPLSSAMPLTGRASVCLSVKWSSRSVSFRVWGVSCGHAWHKEGSTLCDPGQIFTIEGLCSKTKSTGHGLGLRSLCPTREVAGHPLPEGEADGAAEGEVDQGVDGAVQGRQVLDDHRRIEALLGVGKEAEVVQHVEEEVWAPAADEGWGGASR